MNQNLKPVTAETKLLEEFAVMRDEVTDMLRSPAAARTPGGPQKLQEVLAALQALVKSFADEQGVPVPLPLPFDHPARRDYRAKVEQWAILDRFSPQPDPH